MNSPLEQFENHFLLSLSPGPGGLVLTTLSVVSLANTLLLGGVLWWALTGPSVLRPLGPQLVVETWWTTLAGVVRQQLGREQGFVAFFVWLFGWIGVNNLVGLVPLNFTLTSHLCATFFLSLGLNLGFLLGGVHSHGLHFFSLFVPRGAPRVLLPLIVGIEVVSYLIRPLSLALRLFANMMAGHTLVHIVLGFAAGASTLGVVFSSVGIFGVTVLELAIALLQAYVFVTLTTIYARDALEPGGH